MREAARNGHVGVVLFFLDNITGIDLTQAAEEASRGATKSGDYESMKLIFDPIFRRGLDLIHCPGILQ